MKPKKTARPSRDLGRLVLRSIEKGDLDAALRLLEQAERRGKRLEAARRRLADALSERARSPGGQTRSARVAAQREACALVPRDPIAWRDLGRLLHEVGDYQGAIDAYGEADRAGDDAATTRRLSAIARLRLGDGNGRRATGPPAVAARELARADDLTDPAGRVTRALAGVGTGDVRGALTEIASVLQDEPPLPPRVHWNARYYLGRLLLLAGGVREAAVHLREAADLEETDPDLPQRSHPHLLRAILGTALETKEPREAVDRILEAEGIGAERPQVAEQIDAVRRKVLRRLVIDGHLREALPLLEAARRREPASPHREKDLALAFERIGEDDKAIRHWERAIRLGKKLLHGDRSDPTAHLFLLAALRHAARLDRRTGRTPGAARKLTFSLQLDPDRPLVRKELGEMLLGLGKYREALRCLSPLQEDPEGGPEVWTQMGIACDRLGRSEQAISLWERASANHPLAKRLLLARLHERFLLRFRAGDLEGARKEVDRAREIDPDDPDGILDGSCLDLACGSVPAEPAGAGAAPAPAGCRGGAFGLRPEVGPRVGRVVRSLCCGDGTRCEAVKALLLRLTEQDGDGGADPIRRALLAEGCRLVTDSLAASLEDQDNGGSR